DRTGAADPAFVFAHVGMQGGSIGVVPMLDARRIDSKVEGLARGGCVLAEVPQAEAVIAINRLDDVGLDVELDAHLAEIVAEQHADLAADGWVTDPREPSLEHRASLD